MNDQMPVLSVNSNIHIPSSIIFNNKTRNLEIQKNSKNKKNNKNKNKEYISFFWSK